MSTIIEKTFGFGQASPYRAETFNKNNAHIFGRNGGLSVGAIYKSGSNVIIESIKFIQNGVITSKVASSQVAFPPTLPAPFYLTASVPDNKQIDNIAWSFVKRPVDIGENTVLISEWDGTEFRTLPELSIDGLVRHRLDEAIAYKNLGFNNGFQFLPDSGFTQYTITGGQVTDKTGFLVKKEISTVFSPLTQDLEYDRYDTVLWRRLADDPNRIGQLILRAGPTFDSSGLIQNHKTSLGNNSFVNHQAHIINPTDNSLVLLYVESYGDNGSLKFVKYAADRTTVLVSTLTLASQVREFSAVLDKDNNIMIVYVRDGNLYRLKISSIGVVVAASAPIDGLANPIKSPTIRTDYIGNFYVTFLYEVAPAVYAPYFLKTNTGGTVSTSSKRLINSTSNYSRVHFDITLDFICHVAYENVSTNKIEYQELDEIGNALTSRNVISNNTLYGVTLLSGAARNPYVHVAENNDLYISFEQNKGAGSYGVAVYSPTYPQKLGADTVMKDFESASENVLDHTFATDWGNHGHFLVRVTGKLFYYNLYLPSLTSKLLSTFTVNSVDTGDFAVAVDRAGSLVQTFGNLQSGTTNNGSPIDELLFGPATYGPESVFVAANEMAVKESDLNALSPIPTLADTFTVAGSTQGNNGTRTIENIRYATINGTSYKILRDTTVTFNAENVTTVTAQFTKLNGNDLYFCKQTATTIYTFQDIKAEELDSDIIASIIRRSDNVYVSWYDESLVPTTTQLSKEEAFLTSAGSIHFDATAGNLVWGADLYVRDPFRANFKIPAGSVSGLTENKVLYIRVPKAVPLTKNGNTDGYGFLTVGDVSQFTIGKRVFVGDSDTSGVEAVVLNMTSTQLIFSVSMAPYTVNRGAYVIPVDVTLYMGEQNVGDLRPDSLGYINKDIFVIAIRAANLVQFRNGALTLEDQEDGWLGEGPGDDTLAFIGATSQSDSAPAYTNNFSSVTGESLVARASNLDTKVEHHAQDRNAFDFFPAGIFFTWNAGTDLLTWSSADWKFVVPNVGTTPGVHHTINTATKTLTIGAGQVAYIDYSRTTGAGDLTPIVVNDNALPLDRLNADHFVIARRVGNDISIGRNDRFTLADGEVSGDVTLTKLVRGGLWSWDLGTSTITWSAEARIQIRSLDESANLIAAGSCILNADNQVAYVTVNKVAPGGYLTVSVCALEDVPPSGNNIILARRISNNVLIENNLLEDGASIELDEVLSDNIYNMLGLTGNGQTVHNYLNTYYITQNTSHEDAISNLDLALSQIQAQLDVQPDAYIWLADGSTTIFTIGTSGHGDSSIVMSADPSINDIMVTVDGIAIELHKAGTWPIGDGDTDGEFIKVNSTTIRVKNSVLDGADTGVLRKKIMIRPYASGITNVIAVKDEGITVSSVLKSLNFTGIGVTAAESAPGEVEVNISGGGGGGGGGSSYELVTVTNNTGVSIPANRAVRFLANGRIELCDSTIAGKKNPNAITVTTIPDGATVIDAVAVGYRIPGVLTGMGFGFGERVYLGLSGQLVNEASIPDTGAPDDGVLQLGEAYGTASSTTDLLWNKQDYPGF